MSADHASILADVSGMIGTILADPEAASEITMDSSFRDDLEMESIDIVSLGGRLQARYGNAVNFAQFLAGMDLDTVRGLRVGRLVEFIADSLDGAEPSGVRAGS